MTVRRAANAARRAGALAPLLAALLAAMLAAQDQPSEVSPAETTPAATPPAATPVEATQQAPAPPAAQPAPEPAADAPAPINARCPVMTDEDALPEHTLEWQGHTIGFCCNKCPRKFLEHPERYLANLPELGGLAVQQPTTAAPPEAPGLLGRVHPLLVHFPIALLLAGALAEILGALRGRSGSSPAARFCVGLGALGAALAAFTGWQRAEGFKALPGTEGNVDLHRWFAVGTTGLALLLVLIGLWSRERKDGVRAPGLGLYRWGLLIAAVVVAVTAHFGGTLVYGADFPFGD